MRSMTRRSFTWLTLIAATCISRTRASVRISVTSMSATNYSSWRVPTTKGRPPLLRRLVTRSMPNCFKSPWKGSIAVRPGFGQSKMSIRHLQTARYLNQRHRRTCSWRRDLPVSAVDAATLQLIESAVNELRDWRARLQPHGLTVQDVNPSDLCLEGNYEELKGNNDAALAAYLRAQDLFEKDRRKLGSEQERVAFMENKLDCYFRPALMLLDRKRYQNAFAIFERSRSRAMADLLLSRPLNLPTKREQTLFSELQTLKTNIAAQQQKLFNLLGSENREQNTKQIIELRGQIISMQAQFEQVQGRIAKEAPKLKELTTSEPTTLASVQQAAAEGDYDVLYYVVMEYALILWHIDSTGVEVKNIILPHIQLIKKAAALHDSLVARRDAPEAGFDEKTSRQLFLFLIQPMLASIKSHHLVLIPHEELNSMPFQALQDPSTGKYLGESASGVGGEFAAKRPWVVES